MTGTYEIVYIHRKLEKVENDYAALRDENARYHAELTRLKHTSNPLPAPPRQIPFGGLASLTTPSSRAPWSAPAAPATLLHNGWRSESTHEQGPVAAPDPAPVSREDKGQQLSSPRPQIVPGAQPAENSAKTASQLFTRWNRYIGESFGLSFCYPSNGVDS
ncbi:hypothetical protein OBBRIDRAFT_835194 [Obba rivulosa]|uniref:Uncharacterized protein n=1 Tax=Obba rivulosa TaxID=1052685 RepID=A0A8E2AT98_9APHY|nr:hypothetical protein OBBRIDRAFT_835194 [Obba rivulosa]